MHILREKNGPKYFICYVDRIYKPNHSKCTGMSVSFDLAQRYWSIKNSN